MPTREERARRLNAVLHTLHLIYSEGYKSSAGPTLHRTDLSSEAVRSLSVRALGLQAPVDGNGDRCAIATQMLDRFGPPDRSSLVLRFSP
jgi:hypothetical protein